MVRRDALARRLATGKRTLRRAVQHRRTILSALRPGRRWPERVPRVSASPDQTFHRASDRGRTGRDVLLREKCGPPRTHDPVTGDRLRRHGSRRAGLEGHPAD